MSYALVKDISASWEQYSGIARSFEGVPPGLLLHVAGPTDEGIRIIEVWESEAAWRRSAPELVGAHASVDRDVSPRAVVRYLRGLHLVVGEALATTTNDWIAVGPGVAEVTNASERERAT
jgi:hypothetical protein